MHSHAFGKERDASSEALDAFSLTGRMSSFFTAESLQELSAPLAQSLQSPGMRGDQGGMVERIPGSASPAAGHSMLLAGRDRLAQGAGANEGSEPLARLLTGLMFAPHLCMQNFEKISGLGK